MFKAEVFIRETDGAAKYEEFIRDDVGTTDDRVAEDTEGDWDEDEALRENDETNWVADGVGKIEEAGVIITVLVRLSAKIDLEIDSEKLCGTKEDVGETSEAEAVEEISTGDMKEDGATFERDSTEAVEECSCCVVAGGEARGLVKDTELGGPRLLVNSLVVDSEDEIAGAEEK